MARWKKWMIFGICSFVVINVLLVLSIYLILMETAKNTGHSYKKINWEYNEKVVLLDSSNCVIYNWDIEYKTINEDELKAYYDSSNLENLKGFSLYGSEELISFPYMISVDSSEWFTGYIKDSSFLYCIIFVPVFDNTK